MTKSGMQHMQHVKRNQGRVAAQQRDRALARANGIRIERARLKRELTAGQPIQPLLKNPPSELDTATILEVLTWQHRWGEARAKKLCAKARVYPLRTFGKATERERWSLVWALEGSA